MMIQRYPKHPGYLFVSFDKDEMADNWYEAKEAIKARFPFPEGRWDKTIAVWAIVDTPENLEGIRAIGKRYFKTNVWEKITTIAMTGKATRHI
jgi:hypothetical protein